MLRRGQRGFGVRSAHSVSQRAWRRRAARLVALTALVAALPLVGSNAETAAARKGSLTTHFRAAAKTYAVPTALLQAVAYVNTRWVMPRGPALDGGWGMMHLVEGRTLPEAARLTGLPERWLARDARLNILGGAAVLRSAAGRARPRGLAGWYGAVAAVGGGPFAEQVYSTLARGAQARIHGETVVLRPRRTALVRRAAGAAFGRAQYPAALWRPANRGNFQVANRPASHPIRRIVVHTTEGSYAGAISWFQNPASNVATHYVVRSSDGEVTQMLAEKDIGWHAGNTFYNNTAIGIEHEAFVRSCSWYTDAMYRSSARLVAYLTRKYGIPVDREHVIGHNEVPHPRDPRRRGGISSHTDPGRCWDWGKYMALVREQAGGDDEVVIDDRVRRRFSAPGWRLHSRSPQRYGTSYAVARPRAGARPALFRAKVSVSGDYAVYAWWTAYRNRNSAVPVGIETVSGLRWLVVNQQRNGGRWVYLGTFPLRAGTRPYVRFSRKTATRGWIVADAVKLEPVRTTLATGLTGESEGWVLTARQLSRSADGGRAWSAVTPRGVRAATIRGVHFADAANGWAVALPRGAAAKLVLYSTHDGGVGWAATPLPTPPTLDAAAPVTIDFPDPEHGFVALSLEGRARSTAAGVLLATSDGGVAWRQLRLPAAGGVAFPTARTGWLSSAEGGSLYVTRDGGGSWRRVELPVPVRYRASVALAGLPTFTDPLSGVLPVTLAGTRSAVAFLTTRDGGRTWRVAATVPARRPVSPTARVETSIVDADTWVAALEGGRRLVAVRRGRVTQVASRSRPLGTANAAVSALRFASPTTGWAQVGVPCKVLRQPRCRDRQALFATANGGVTWRRLAPP
jgi:N-acetyl-anhydromuramyl-L-alanine amidase AmpD/photosystem II stability/assembly factor-like uncharacterized protein